MNDLIKAADDLAKHVDAQLLYMDMCNDKGDLERNMRNALTAYRAARDSAGEVDDILECLEWFIANDDTNDIPSNEFWIHGLERAREVAARHKGETYEPREWANWKPGIDTFQA